VCRVVVGARDGNASVAVTPGGAATTIALSVDGRVAAWVAVSEASLRYVEAGVGVIATAPHGAHT